MERGGAGHPAKTSTWPQESPMKEGKKSIVSSQFSHSPVSHWLKLHCWEVIPLYVHVTASGPFSYHFRCQISCSMMCLFIQIQKKTVEANSISGHVMGHCAVWGHLRKVGVGHDWVTSLSLFTFMHWRRKWQPTPVLLPGESQGQGSLVGCHLWGHTELDTTEAT